MDRFAAEFVLLYHQTLQNLPISMIVSCLHGKFKKFTKYAGMIGKVEQSSKFGTRHSKSESKAKCSRGTGMEQSRLFEKSFPGLHDDILKEKYIQSPLVTWPKGGYFRANALLGDKPHQKKDIFWLEYAPVIQRFLNVDGGFSGDFKFPFMGSRPSALHTSTWRW